MKVIPFVHEGLGNSSYLVDIGNQAAVIVDPNRTVRPYLAAADERGLTVRAVFETHLHADFVSGAREIAAATGSKIFLPSDAHSKLPHVGLQAGSSIDLDGISASAIGSPGHTPEHLAYAFKTASGPLHLFSGGSLIVAGAARTDLIAPDMTEALTRAQFRTIHSAFSGLPDDTVLLPTHGGGSFCSTGTSQERWSTLGRERARNPLLSIEDEEEFVHWFPTTFRGTPAYYSRMRPLNQRGPRLRRDIALPRPLTPAEFGTEASSALIIDARARDDYAAAHIPGSLSAPFGGRFPVWLGWLAPAGARLLLVTRPGQVQAVIDECLLVGYEDFAGYLDSGVEAWGARGLELRRTLIARPLDARKSIADGALSLDVREPDEFRSGHIEGSLAIPLGTLQGEIERLPRDRPVIAYCAAGDRASSAASLLERAGFTDVLNLAGGIEAWREAGLPLSQA